MRAVARCLRVARYLRDESWKRQRLGVEVMLSLSLMPVTVVIQYLVFSATSQKHATIL